MTDKKSDNYNMEYKFKVIVLGEYSSGKTSILKRLRDESFNNIYSTTIGVDFYRHSFYHDDLFNDTIEIEEDSVSYTITKSDYKRDFKHKDKRFKKYHNENKKTKKENVSYSMLIWDTSGQEKFLTITRAYFRNVSAVILVFDITNKRSFQKLEFWYKDIMDKINPEIKETIPFVVVGNKTDLSNIRAVNFETAFNYAKSIDAIYIETSAKLSYNIQNIFSRLIEHLVFCINHEKILPSKKNGIVVLKKDIELFLEDYSNPRNNSKNINKINANIETEEKKIECCNIM